MEKLPISLIIIAHNEALNLSRCLDSIAPWISEIVAVINDCTDETATILQSYNAKVIEHAWMGMTEQKNIALSHATQPWVINLDADEEVSPRLAECIRDFITNQKQHQALGAYFPRKTWFLGRWIRHGDWYPDYTLRLFYRAASKFAGGKDHDSVTVDGTTLKLSGDLFHYSFPNLNFLLRKIISFSDHYLDRQLAKKKRFSTLGTIFRALWRFVRSYLLRLGFLDGFPGLFVAVQQAFATFYRHSRLYEHEKRSIKPQPEASDYAKK
ncbi:MAG: glycosyltransferase family 2 protein [Verrucomicrobia bacterium CG_4_10_14_3_um_filter_43_23]|nr:MAG: hypothetical protein AUJ82_07665 [Verrucomicrobia bacterium CG1_02_43_26]PIP58649.1 MAG: glycosyl transferase [Verrucomicrobia bacterium CG22_combo_CG10-13_8_21_14_all_43_17]PIX58511.1 MAG: glycosyltransferase family 2 protein [Verrucomicrobia bacterium CG_4_10_14_3_um_filter_43_23]PIY61243.1 MAG: glycosyltransferase family 2 protein [Verrucomicrobia bacterium CG_4_10_14_0_8_um_filter_43_34]PJA43551.1 MAG: glycosyltransferase family 2 protein [Verrucomicrobia bacterium CG_4_9_14_3_um_fi